MSFGSFILKNLTRRPMRSGLTLTALATAIAAVVALLGISNGFTSSFAGIYEAHAVDIVVSRQGSADRLSSSIDEAYAERIAGLASVDRAAAVLLETLSIEEEGIYGIPTMGIAVGSWLLEDYQLVSQVDIAGDHSDTLLVKAESERGGLWLGVHLAERLSVSAGDSISIFGEDYLIGAVFQSPATWENGALIVPLPTLQAMTDRKGQATYINVVLNAGASGSGAEKAIQEIEALDSRLLPLATADFVESDTRMQLAGAMAWMTSVIALGIGSIGTLNTMLTSVMERTQEIGILRAIGWPKGRVVGMILCESCGLALLASLFGTLLAIGLTWLLSQSPAVKGVITPEINGWVMLQGLVLALGIGLLGATLPAWRAAAMHPTEAFREH